MPGALIARGEYAEQNPENVAKFLAVYLRAWKWMNAHKPEAIAMMKKFYDQGGVSISEASMKKEFDTRPTFDLASQIARMDRSRGNSDMDAWFGQIVDLHARHRRDPDRAAVDRLHHRCVHEARGGRSEAARLCEQRQLSRR